MTYNNDEINYDQKEVAKAFAVIKDAMAADTPQESGSYAHSWHCNIAMACHDAMPEEMSHQEAHRIGNEAASRFMKLCFDVETVNPPW